MRKSSPLKPLCAYLIRGDGGGMGGGEGGGVSCIFTLNADIFAWEEKNVAEVVERVRWLLLEKIARIKFRARFDQSNFALI